MASNHGRVERRRSKCARNVLAERPRSYCGPNDPSIQMDMGINDSFESLLVDKQPSKQSLCSSRTSIMSDPSTGQLFEVEDEEDFAEPIDGSLSSELSNDEIFSPPSSPPDDKVGCHGNSNPLTDDVPDLVTNESSNKSDTPPPVQSDAPPIAQSPLVVIPEELSEEHVLIDKLGDVMTTPISVSSNDTGVFILGTSYTLLRRFDEDNMEYVTGMGVQSKSITTITALGSSLNQLV